MTDAAIELLQRYREREAKGVGGLTPYGMPHRHQETFQQQGVVFIKDATILDPLDPSNPQHVPAWTQVDAIEIQIDGTSTTLQRIVAEFERSMSVVGIGVLRNKFFSAYTPVASSAADNAPNHQEQVTIKLIKTPLVGPLAIDQITHDDLGSLTLETLLTTSPTDWTGAGSGIVLNTSDLEAGLEHYLRPGALLQTGPYFGIVIEPTGIVSFIQNGDNLTTTYRLFDSKVSVSALLRSHFTPPILMGL